MKKLKVTNLREDVKYLETLGKWHHKEWKDLNPGFSLEERLRMMHRYLNEDYIPSTYVAVDGELLGSAAVVECDMDSKPNLKPWLASVFVKPEARGRGIGSELVKSVLQCTQNEGIDKLYLFTPDKETFYKRIGWNKIEKVMYHERYVTIMEFVFKENDSISNVI